MIMSAVDCRSESHCTIGAGEKEVEGFEVQDIIFVEMQ